MARLLFAVVAIAAVIAGILFSSAVTRAEMVPDQPKSITLSELNKLQVIGWLGQPLGKIVTIEGVVPDATFVRSKEQEDKTLLRVQTVDGIKLSEAAVFCFSSLLSGIEEPKAGAKFKYIAYETGGFTGVPEGNFAYVGPLCCTSYYFTTHFVIIRDAMKPVPQSSAITPPPVRQIKQKQ